MRVCISPTAGRQAGSSLEQKDCMGWTCITLTVWMGKKTVYNANNTINETLGN